MRIHRLMLHPTREPKSEPYSGTRGHAMPRLGDDARWRCTERPGRWVLWRAFLALAALALGAASARAEVLVNNLNQDAAPLDRIDYGKREYAEGRLTSQIHRVYVPNASQHLRTGSNAAGYTVEEVRLDLTVLGTQYGPDTPGPSARMSVALYTDDGGVPGNLIASLYPVSNLRNGATRFQSRPQMGTYPHLEPDTHYHRQVTWAGTTLYMEVTESDTGENTQGWSIGNDALSYIGMSSHYETLDPNIHFPFTCGSGCELPPHEQQAVPAHSDLASSATASGRLSAFRQAKHRRQRATQRRRRAASDRKPPSRQWPCIGV